MRTEGTRSATFVLRCVADFVLDCLGYKPEARLYEEQTAHRAAHAAHGRLRRVCLKAHAIAEQALSRPWCGADRTMLEALAEIKGELGGPEAGPNGPRLKVLPREDAK